VKKILLVTRPICPPWDEASKNFAYHLAQNVRDFELHLMTSASCKIDNLPGNVKQEPIYKSVVFNFPQKLRSLIYQILSRKSFDIIHYCFTPAKLNSFFIQHLIKNKKMKTVQTIATLREDLFSGVEIKKLMFGNVIITYSKYARNKLEKLGFKNASPGSELGSTTTRVEQIYPGIDLNLYSPAPKNFSLMSQLGISQGDFVVVYPGEYTRLGNIDNLINKIIKDFNILEKNNIKFTLAFRVKNEKDSRKKEEIKKTLEKHKIESQVLLPDTFMTMEKIYNLADVVIFPVENMEGKFDVPLAVIEAMACARPVIISDLPILNEFAGDTISVKIKAGDMEELFEKILDIHKNRKRYENIGENAKKFAEENFDIKKVAERYQDVYKKL
jgi:glycosyltransferase involved in cell wall biosynthesis